MSIPAAVVCGPGRLRRLMRRALAGIVTEVILERRLQSDLRHALPRDPTTLATDLLRQRRRNIFRGQLLIGSTVCEYVDQIVSRRGPKEGADAETCRDGQRSPAQ